MADSLILGGSTECVARDKNQFVSTDGLKTWGIPTIGKPRGCSNAEKNPKATVIRIIW